MVTPIQVDLNDKVCVVTGAGGVLCSLFAKALAECGAKVALLDLNLEQAQMVAREIGENARAYKVNVLDKENLKAVREEIIADFGTCDILINGAGGNSPKATTTNEYYFDGDIDKDVVSFFDLDKDGVDFVFNLNFLGTLIPTQIFAKDMVDKAEAVVINVSSMNAFTPLTKIPAYSGAKAAISNFTQWLAVHFSKTNIRVNAIAPGFFVTKQNEALLFNQDGSKTPRTDKILSATPMGRFGKPEELLGSLLFLCDSKLSSFVTGIVIPVDGGFSSYSGV